MRIIQRIFQLISWLSLDVVIGAMASLYFFQELLHVSLDWTAFGLLGLAVWTIYNLDHVLDARKILNPSSPRRVFHQRYQVVLGVGIIIAVGSGLVWAFFWMGWGKELQLTLVLTFSMAGCRWAIQKFGLVPLKEVSIALFYLLGTTWLPLLRTKAIDLTWEVLIFALLFFVVALLNLWMLSFLDREEDRQDGFLSLAHVHPQQLIQWIRRLSFFGIFVSLAAFILLPSFFRPFFCILLLLLLVHYLTFFQTRLSPTQKRQRMELAFWIPWLLLWI